MSTVAELSFGLAVRVLPSSGPSPAPSTAPSRVDGGISFADWVAAVGACLTFAAVVIAALTYWQAQQQGRRERRAKAFAEALQAVEEYMEGPYRIRRRPDEDEAGRWQITESLSAVKARVSFHQAWLQTEGLDEVCDAYESLVRASLVEAGPAMTAAWESAGVRRDAELPLGQAYPRPQVDQARDGFLAAVRRVLDS